MATVAVATVALVAVVAVATLAVDNLIAERRQRHCTTPHAAPLAHSRLGAGLGVPLPDLVVEGLHKVRICVSLAGQMRPPVCLHVEHLAGGRNAGLEGLACLGIYSG